MSDERTCTICKEKKDMTQFYKTKYRCKTCMKPIYYKNNQAQKEWKCKEKEIEKTLSPYIYIDGRDRIKRGTNTRQGVRIV